MFVDIMAAYFDLIMLDTPTGWLATLPTRFTEREIIATTLKQARTISRPRFIKPMLEKCFPSGVYTICERVPEGSDLLPDDTPVYIAEPVHWEIEFRGYILNRKLMTLSPYLRDGMLVEDEDSGTWPASKEDFAAAKAFYELLLEDESFELPPAIVLDIGRIRDRGWAIIETNGAWGAGIYGCDAHQVLSVLEYATQPSNSMIETRWRRTRVEIGW